MCIIWRCVRSPPPPSSSSSRTAPYSPSYCRTDARVVVTLSRNAISLFASLVSYPPSLPHYPLRSGEIRGRPTLGVYHAESYVPNTHVFPLTAATTTGRLVPPFRTDTSLTALASTSRRTPVGPRHRRLSFPPVPRNATAATARHSPVRARALARPPHACRRRPQQHRFDASVALFDITCSTRRAASTILAASALCTATPNRRPLSSSSRDTILRATHYPRR